MLTAFSIMGDVLNIVGDFLLAQKMSKVDYSKYLMLLVYLDFKNVSLALQVADWSEIPKLGHMKELATVYFERNPIQTHHQADYRRKLMLALPMLSQIDATLCR